MTIHKDNELQIIKFVQAILHEEPDRTSITAGLISEKIDLVIKINPKWGENLDRSRVTEELIRRFSLFIGHDATLTNNTDHVAWLFPERKKDWRYWQRYREWLETDLSPVAIDALDRSTDHILGLLEDPLRDGPWDRRGLVVGHVQSGKTGNYTGLISKAADAGYKIIIVLAGLHNNLRSQTQSRLDEGFLGYETKPIGADTLRIIGVGEIDSDPTIRPNYATNRMNNGDFNTAIARHLGISPEQRPWLFVVKKNKTVLEHLHRWLRNHVANAKDAETERAIITNLPLLLIDDEADHASVDTGAQSFSSEGHPDPEHNPRAINGLIRRIIRTFTRAAYVGYTATPFANIFIHERGKTAEEGPDLFPSSFIVNLAAPSTYVGPSTVFGIRQDTDRQAGLPLVRSITDNASADGKGGWMPNSHKNGHRPVHDGPTTIPSSLIEAIDTFLLSCATRYTRGQQKKHMSMLVHVTRFNSVQQEVFDQVQAHVRHMRQRLSRRLDSADIEARLEQLWMNDFVPTSEIIQDECPEHDCDPLPSWDKVLDRVNDVLDELQVKIINGTAKDALEYSNHESRGLRLIAIGGEKLSRGLTLEGLSVSYFLRSSKMYDTLMQMGRWFGYRPGYLDICRLYTTTELSEWYGHIADAAEELREEFDAMVASGATPRDYGIKVKSHPVLMITSPLKMRSAKTLHLSFSGTLLETVTFHPDIGTLKNNYRAFGNLIRQLGTPHEGTETEPIKRRGERHKWQGYLWKDVPSIEVSDFLRTYTTPPFAQKVNGTLIADFIDRMTAHGELTAWTVAIIGGGEGDTETVAPGITVQMIRRSVQSNASDRFSIGRLLSDRDESIDLDDLAWEAALKLTQEQWERSSVHRSAEMPDKPNGPMVRKVRGFGADGVLPHPERGLLLVYLIDPAKSQEGWDPGCPVVAFGVSFPGSNTIETVEYKANNVLWEQEYGAGD